MLGVLAAAIPAANARQLPAYPRRADGATHVSSNWQVPALEVAEDAVPTETLADALEAAYQTAPALQLRRYELRAADEDYALALAELRPNTQVQITGNYTRIDPGDSTQANRPLADRLNSSFINTNRLGAELIAEQPLYTGGKASADQRAAREQIAAGRAQLRGTEGDLFLQVVTSYIDIGRDQRTLALREASVRQFEATRNEVSARQEAGELTRTDLAQAQTQLENARTFVNLAQQQLLQDQAAFAGLVGHQPGRLAAPPPLPQMPATLDEAFDLALRLNPEIAGAVAAERASRARIAAAAAEGRPRLSLRGGASIGGKAVPLRYRDEDRTVTAQAVLTIPLTTGGRVDALVSQAQDRNSQDRIRIEVARRAMVERVVDAWNAVATAQRNVLIQSAQLGAARILDEGTFEEYRAGLRSTFDVLFAHGALRDAEIGLANSCHDLYLAQATLLRHVGLLEARTILRGTPLYDPDVNTRSAARRGAMPWDPAVRALDRVHQPPSPTAGLEQPAQPDIPPVLVEGTPLPQIEPATAPLLAPLPGTTGTPRPRHTRKRP